MDKGIGQGLQRKSMKRRRRSKGFARALAEYLLADSYMYAPLINSPPAKPAVHPLSTVEEVARDASARSPSTPGRVGRGAQPLHRLLVK